MEVGESGGKWVIAIVRFLRNVPFFPFIPYKKYAKTWLKQ
jgi:hypothetical protein